MHSREGSCGYGNKTLEQEILEIISKNLPEQVGSVLKKRLEEAEADRKRVEDMDYTVKYNRDKIATLEEQIKKYEALEVWQKDLDIREKEISKRESNQKVWEAELRANEADRRANELAGFVGMVFKSPVFRKTVSGYQYVASGQYGTQQAPHNHMEDTTED